MTLKQKTKFQSLKDELATRAKKAHACNHGYKKGVLSTNYNELADVIHRNFAWLCCNGVIDADIIKTYRAQFRRMKIFLNRSLDDAYTLFTEGNHTTKGNSVSVILTGKLKAKEYSVVSAFNDSMVEAFDNSDISLYGESRGKCYDYSKVYISSCLYCEIYGCSRVHEASKRHPLWQEWSKRHR